MERPLFDRLMSECMAEMMLKGHTQMTISPSTTVTSSGTYDTAELMAELVTDLLRQYRGAGQAPLYNTVEPAPTSMLSDDT